MTDVARVAGVSIQTISAVINGKSGISEATRERVRRVIEELDYHPNMLASSLRSQRSTTIGVLVASITNPFFPGVVRGIEDAAHRNGYSVFLCNTDDDPEKQNSYLRLLRRHRVGGLILASGTGTVVGQRVVQNLLDHSVPVVMLSDRHIHPKVAVMMVDDYKAGYDVVAHLLDLGHRRIGIITGPAGHHGATARLEAYYAALRDRAIAVDPDLVIPGAFSTAGGQAGAFHLLSLVAPPTAIVAGNDLAAIGAIAVAKRLGKRVPEEVAVTGFDDIEMAALYDPSITTIAQPQYEMGAAAMEAILDRVGDPKLEGGVTMFETRLIVRGSTVSTSTGASTATTSPSG
jgi:LacI family transcriptional regulator